MRNVRPFVFAFLSLVMLTSLTLGSGAILLRAGEAGLEYSSVWKQSTSADFRAGQPVNVVIGATSGGRLQLGPDESLASRVYPAYRRMGLYTSPVLTAQRQFNRLQLALEAQIPAGSALEAELRVSPDGRSWSPWEPVDVGGEAIGLTSSALYAQYRLTLLARSLESTPFVEEVALTYGYAATLPAHLVGPGPSVAPTYRLYATREGLVGGTTANGHVITERDHFVALPSRRGLASNGGYEYQVRLTYNGRTVTEPVWDVGPWNIHDNYWDDARDIYSYLPPGLPPLSKGLPEAQAANLSGYNGGKDEFGRTALNPAGIDLADGTFWDSLGMAGNDWVDVTFLWEEGAPSPPPTPSPAPEPNRPEAMSYNGVSSAARTLFLPVVMRDAYGGWTSGINLQNAGASPAAVTVTYYDTQGQPVLATDGAVPARGYWGLYQGGESLPVGFAGTAVVTASQPVAAVVNEIASTGGAMSYEGISQPSTAAYLPLVANNAYGNWTTGLNLQNASDSPASVRVVYYNDDGTVAGRQVQDLPGRGYWAVYNGSNLLPGGFAGSARVWSSQPVAVVVNEVSGNAGAMSYRGLSAPSTTAYFPVVMNNAYGGWTTGLNVVNTGPSPASATLTYFNASGGVVGSKVNTIPAFGRWAIYQGGTELPNGFAGSAVLSSSQPVVAIANEISPMGAMSYSGERQGAKTIYLPVVLNDAYGGWTTGVNLLSLESESATITYLDAAGQSVGSATKALSANSYWALYQGGGAFPPSYAGSAIISSSSPLVVVVNETLK